MKINLAANYQASPSFKKNTSQQKMSPITEADRKKTNESYYNYITSLDQDSTAILGKDGNVGIKAPTADQTIAIANTIVALAALINDLIQQNKNAKDGNAVNPTKNTESNIEFDYRI